ncbi:LysR family transcriptional regulator [Undibacterium sp.]|uniref:LysR family transcriptional regulator n=1 Tax=Undibacterium sp. TaxID=1914977 RepID=UPI00374CA085
MDSRSGEMLVFAKVVEAGSFSAAGTLLDLSPSAVSKLITRIEERLGVLLFQRSTRQLVVTTEGRNFYDSCIRILDDIEEAEQGIAGGKLAPHGVLRINVSVPFGTNQLIPVLPEFAQRYPEITLDLSLTDALVDLQRERIDVAVRMGPLADASFRARTLGESRRAVIASPQYLATHGHPKTPADLAQHRCLNFNFRRTLEEWPFRIGKQVEHLVVRGGMLTNNGESMRELTLQGMGISRLAMFHVGRDIREGRLVELLPEYNPGDTEEINAIFLNQRFMPHRVRVFIDFLVERLGPALKNVQ